MKLHQIIESHWQNPRPYLSVFLSPLSGVFQAGAAWKKRRTEARKLPVPVVVVGNLHAGGTGKTPITASLVLSLKNKGLKVGIVSRGYGRTLKEIHILHADSTVSDAGDEPLMLFRQTGVPVAVGANRFEVGEALLAQYPDLQVIVSDDGLQHYTLARDLEIAVFPANDVGRKLAVLPQGALREPLERLHDVDAIVLSQMDLNQFNNKNQLDKAKTFFSIREEIQAKIFASHIQIGLPHRYHQYNEIFHPNAVSEGQKLAAIAGIARPERFFQALEQKGFQLNQKVVLRDHEAISPQDFPEADAIFITEKDAVKLPENAPYQVWVLPIYAIIEPDLGDFVVEKLNLPVNGF